MLQLKVCLLPSSALPFRGRRTDTEEGVSDINLVWSLLSGTSARAVPGVPSSQHPESASAALVLGWAAATVQPRLGSKGEILQVQWATGQETINQELLLHVLEDTFCPDHPQSRASTASRMLWGYFCELFWSIPPPPHIYFQPDFLLLKIDV